MISSKISYSLPFIFNTSKMLFMYAVCFNSQKIKAFLIVIKNLNTLCGFSPEFLTILKKFSNLLISQLPAYVLRVICVKIGGVYFFIAIILNLPYFYRSLNSLVKGKLIKVCSLLVKAVYYGVGL